MISNKYFIQLREIKRDKNGEAIDWTDLKEITLTKSFKSPLEFFEHVTKRLGLKDVNCDKLIKSRLGFNSFYLDDCHVIQVFSDGIDEESPPCKAIRFVKKLSFIKDKSIKGDFL